MILFPSYEWLKSYSRAEMRGDLAAGITVAIMLVPQGMAYAMLAGLPPVMGLYASTIPLIVYAVFGSSRHLAVGPVAMMSLLVMTACSELASPGSPDYIGLVLLVTFMFGAMQIVLGFIRMGFLINFVSHAAISGFTSAAAIIIFSSQLKHLLGVKIPSTHSMYHLLIELGRHAGELNLFTLGIGMGGIVILLVLKRFRPRFPAGLLVAAGSTLLVYLFRLDALGVGIVGKVPRGLPAFSVPGFQLSLMMRLVPMVLTLVFVGFMESIAVAELIASREKYRVEPNQELKGLGLANLFCAFFSGYPVTGGFSRTAVNYEAGARTPFSSLVTAFLILLTLVFFTPLFYYLPHATLAAVITVAVMGLIDLKEAVKLLRVKKTDGVTLLVTFVLTLGLGVETGIVCGVIFSLLVFLWRSAHPHIAELGFLEKERVFRNLKRHPEAKPFPGVLILRVDASLYFANMGFIEDYLRRRIEEEPELRAILFDLSGVNDMDAVAAGLLEKFMEQYSRRGIRFLFASMKGPVRDIAARAGWPQKYGEDIDFLSIEQALNALGMREVRISP